MGTSTIANPFEVLLAKLDAIEQRIINLEASRKTETEEEELLGAATAVKVFNPQISKATLSNWVKSGLIQSHKIGARVYYKKSELLEAVTRLKKYSHHPLKNN